MGYDYFQNLVLALSPDLPTICSDDGPQPFEMYVYEYDTWRTRLPEEELEKAPILKIFNFSWEKDPDANTKFSFATRCVPAPDDSITETSPSTAHETDVDRKRRDELIELIKRRNNFSVDKSRLRFEAIKDVHPYYDSLGVRIFSLPPFHFYDADLSCSDAGLMFRHFSRSHASIANVLHNSVAINIPPFCGGTKQLGNILTEVRDGYVQGDLNAVGGEVEDPGCRRWVWESVSTEEGERDGNLKDFSVECWKGSNGRFDQRRNEAKSSKRNATSGVITPIGLAARVANDEELSAAGLARGAENVTDAKRKENQKNSDVNRTRGGQREGVLRLRRLTFQHCGHRQHHRQDSTHSL
ncbi:hypothetical protein K438DRAFT_1769538 [Mycena galopus ATCC 62051]|nr:hypothetical protein K438DRAFT_1769538 [Mycena galopus ATCC 62051]